MRAHLGRLAPFCERHLEALALEQPAPCTTQGEHHCVNRRETPATCPCSQDTTSTTPESLMIVRQQARGRAARSPVPQMPPMTAPDTAAPRPLPMQMAPFRRAGFKSEPGEMQGQMTSTSMSLQSLIVLVNEQYSNDYSKLPQLCVVIRRYAADLPLTAL